MKQLTGIDASFLYMESVRTFGHVSSLSIYESPDDPDFRPFDAFRSQIERRLPWLEPYRRRLVEVPFQLDHPYWIRDPNFDLDFHVRHIALPEPGDEHQMAEQVARIIARPLDRARPLWEAYVFEGLQEGGFAVLSKTHHATIDGASGTELLTIMLDPTLEPAEPEPIEETWRPEPMPSQLEMWNRTMGNLVRSPGRLARLQLRVVREVARITRSEGLDWLAGTVREVLPARRRPEQRDEAPAPPARLAPGTPFNKVISPHRRFAYRSVPLDEVKTIKNRLGATVNDVVMGVCAGALRQYLLNHGALPDDPLVAMVPVSIRTGEETDKWTNRVSGIFSRLPTNVDDPVERLRVVHASMVAAKEQFDLMPAEILIDITQFAPPALATRAMRMATSLRIADRVNPPVNLVISNVPGPRVPLYMAGAKLLHYYPVSTIADGQGLNITVQSYLDKLDFGLVGDRELVPDLWDLVDLCVDEVGVLLRQTAATPAPARKATTKKATAKKPPARKAAARTPAKKSPATRAIKKSPAKRAIKKSPARKKAASSPG